MKFNLLPSAVITVLSLSLMASHADTLLLSDDFTVTTPLTGTDATTELEAANNNLAARQSGTHAGVSYTVIGTGYSVGMGNTTADYFHGATTATTTDGNNLTLSGSSVQLDLPINLALAGNNALTISFDLFLPGGANWPGISLSTVHGGAAATNVQALTTLFAVRTKPNTGAVQAFNATTGEPYYNMSGLYVEGPSTQTAPTYTPEWTIVLSDVVSGAAGTGSAFAGNGTWVSIYNGDTLLSSQALTTEFGDTTLYLSLFSTATSSNTRTAFDNLSIAAVPEPASVGYLVAAGLGFVAFAARRRRAPHA